jgi:hypothetical protein
MSSQPPQPTAALEQQITAFIRAGGFPHVAAEAAGVPARTFRRWLRHGNKPDSDPIYRTFAAAVRQATAQARLRAEIAVLESKPLDWLKYGPGKETARSRGWTGTVRAATPARGSAGSALEDAVIRAFLADVVQALAPYPEARAAAACAAQRLPVGRRGGWSKPG